MQSMAVRGKGVLTVNVQDFQCGPPLSGCSLRDATVPRTFPNVGHTQRVQWLLVKKSHLRARSPPVLESLEQQRILAVTEVRLWWWWWWY